MNTNELAHETAERLYRFFYGSLRESSFYEEAFERIKTIVHEALEAQAKSSVEAEIHQSSPD